MASPSQFVHLRLHTEYSLVDGLVRIKPLVKRVVEHNMPAVAITDVTNLFALVKFQRTAMNNGVKPIFGSDIWMVSDEPEAKPARLCCLAQNLTGYKHLTELISLAYTKGQATGIPIVKRAWLREKSDGLILLSGAKEGDIGQALLAGDRDRAVTLLQSYQAEFPDRFYMELQRTGRVGDEQCLHASVELAQAMDCPVVATNDVRFLAADDFDAHEVRVGIHDGYTLNDTDRERRYSEQQYFRSTEEMIALFSDIPEAIENSLEIAKRCSVEVPLGTYYLPDYPVPEGMTMDRFFRERSAQGLEKRLETLFDKEDEQYEQTRQLYVERLQEELDIIISMGFPGYFLIVMDFIQWAKNNDVPVGPGRGSGAGSLVAYALEITDLDPIEYDLLFERFLNPERVSMPDFDVDFCMEGRDRVIDYVARTYGRGAVSQIITFGSMAAKAVVRDVGRVQGKSYGFVDRIAKMVPFELGMTLTKALDQEESLREAYDQDEEIKELLDMALKLEGITRNAGKHAGGVVIAPSELTDFVPLYCDSEGNNLVTQFDKDDVESAGLVKFDFLGLRTLTIVDWAVKTVNADISSVEDQLDISRIPLDDPATFELLQAAETTAVFQLESRGMKDLIKRLKPSHFEDIVALVALFRPGPLQSGMVDDFINRKHGRQKVDYPHPDLEPILKTTYGVILYQEQVMQIAQVLAGYTLGGADMLRRAMGKKKPEEMAKQRVIFLEGATKRGVSEEQATYIFDLMEKFAGYGFNKSHSAAYALVSYQTAWLKAHYPAAFMAAVLSSDMDNTDKVVMLVDECRQMKLALLSPNVQYSQYKFTVNDQGQIIYGLGAIKGVGEGAIESMIELRKDRLFNDLFDFCERIDGRKLNRRTLEALIRSGALDQLGPNRAVLIATLPTALQRAEQCHRNQEVGMMDLFGGLGGEASVITEEDWVAAEPWSEDERLSGESETLGLYLTGHPIDQYLSELKHVVTARIVDLQPTPGASNGRRGGGKGASSTAAGLVVAIRTMKSKRGDRMAFLSIDDQSGRLEVSVFGEAYKEHKDLLEKGALLIVEGEVSVDDFSGNLKMLARKIIGVNQMREQYAKRLRLNLSADMINSADDKHAKLFVQSLKAVLAPFQQGKCPITIRYKTEHAKAQFVLSDQWRVSPAQDLLVDLRRLVGKGNVELEYG